MQDHKEIEKLFEMISLDLGSMPRPVNGNKAFLLIVDAFSKLMTATALPNAHADTLVDALWLRWFSYFGLPKFIQSDQGSYNHHHTTKPATGVQKERSDP